MVDRQTSFPHVWPGVSRHINDNYCISIPVCRQLTRGKQTLKSVNFYQPHWTRPDHRNNQETVNLYKCKLSCCKSCTYVSRAATKERRKSSCCLTTSIIKICEQCSLCRSIVFCQTCTKCPKCCTKSACRGQTKSVLGNLESLGGRTQSSTNVEGYTVPFQSRPNFTEKVTDNHQLLYISTQEPLPVGGITSADKGKCSRVGQKSRISGLLQLAIFGPKTQQQMETITRSEQSQQIPQGRKIQNGDTRNNPDLPTDGSG